MIRKAVLTIIILSAVVWNATVYYTDHNIKEKYDSTVYNSINKIWIARGLYDSREQENSITSMQRAFNAGAVGVEVDFYYDIDSHTFIVAHNRPKKGENGELQYEQKEGGILTLEDLFLTTGKDHYFYLDYKNLDRITDQQTNSAIQRLEKITQFDSLKKRVYIEGSNPMKLSMYTDAGFKTLLGIHPLPESNIFASIVVSAYKMAYYFENISALALNYGDIDNPVYGSQTEKALKGIPIFIFHTPIEENFLRSLVDKEDVKVILPGRGISINRTYITGSKYLKGETN